MWIATVSGIPLDFNWDKFSAEGSLTNDLSSNTPEDDLPVADFAVGNPSDNLLSNNFPDDSNPDIFSQVREKSDVDTFRQLPDEPTVEPHVEPSVEPPVEPPVQPPAEPSGQSLDDSTLGLFGDSSDSDTSISVSKNPATLTPSCANFFGLACCMSGSGNSDSSMHDVSGCSGRMRLISPVL